MTADEGLGWLAALIIAMGAGGCVLFVMRSAMRHGPAGSDHFRRIALADERVPAAAAGHHLGDFAQAFSGNWVVPGEDKPREIVGVVPVLLLSGLPYAAYQASRVHLWWLGVLVAAVGVATGWWAAVCVFQKARGILEYDQGFVCRGKEAVHAFRWADITTVSQGQRSESLKSGRVFVTPYYDLRARDGRLVRVFGEVFGLVVQEKAVREEWSPAASTRRPMPGPAEAALAGGEADRQAGSAGRAQNSAVHAVGQVSAGEPLAAKPAQEPGGFPRQVAEAAARRGLGQPHGSIQDQTRIAGLRALTGLASAFVLAVGGIGLAIVVANVYGAALCLILMPASFVALLWGIPTPRRVARASSRAGACTCYLYTGGLIVTGLLGGIQSWMAWEEIAGIYRQRLQHDFPLYEVAHHPPRPWRYYRILIVGTGPRPINLHTSKVACHQLLGLHARMVLPALTSRLLAGQTLRFGPFLVGPAGVDDGVTRVGWAEISGCDTSGGLSPCDLIGIGREGQEPPIRVDQKHVPDVLLFQQIVWEFAGRRWPGATAPGESAQGGRVPDQAAPDVNRPVPGNGHAVGRGLQYRLLAFLAPLAISRIAVALGGGLAMLVVGIVWHAILLPHGVSWPVRLIVTALCLPVIAPVGYALAVGSLWRVVFFLTSSPAAGRRSLRRRRVAVGLLVAAAAGLFLGWPGPAAVLGGLTRAFFTALPAAPVLILAIWAYLITQRRVRVSKYRWLRHAADLPVAVLAGIGMLMLFDGDLVIRQPEAAVLFPLSAWASVWAWRRMRGSEKLWVKAGADITLSLLLGTDLVLFLVWGANILGLSQAEVAILRGALARAGSIVDLPWWLWLALLILLAVASLAFARWPDRLKPVIRWFGRLHVVPVTGLSRRLFSGIHVGLLVIVLIGLAAPASLEAALQRPLQVSYTVAFERELEQAGEQAAYTAIQRQFSSAPAATPPVRALTAVVSQIYDISPPPLGDHDATSTEDDLARLVGQFQAAALGLPVPLSVPETASAATATAGFTKPIRDASDLTERLGELGTQQQEEDAIAKHVDNAAELAAAAVASTIQIPGLGDNQVVQIVWEYLSGLIEDSPLKDLFSAWATRLTGRTTPPDAATLVVPDPASLEDAASGALSQERAKEGLTDAVITDPALLNKPAITATVQMANQDRLVAAGSTSCYECAPPGTDNQPDPPAEDNHGEPPDEP